MSNFQSPAEVFARCPSPWPGRESQRQHCATPGSHLCWKVSGHDMVITYRVHSWDSVLLASAWHGQRKLQRVSLSPLIFLGSENTAAAATSVIDSEVLTWDVYSSMARSGLPNSRLGSAEVKAGTAADQRILGMALPSNVTIEGRRQIS